IVERYRDGKPWQDTDLFTQIYARRIANGETLRGCRTIKDLLAYYYSEVDALHADMAVNGFRAVVDGAPVPLPEVFIGRDGEVILSNQGNHRVAMAKQLGMPHILAKVKTVHADLVDWPDL